MKIKILIPMLLLVACQLFGQEHEILDTIYANEQKNVALFFPEPIRQGITGSDNFVFTYNREKEQYFGLLQATPGKESNLLVINRNGAVFSYIVRYRKSLGRLNYFVPATESIGNEKPKITSIGKRDDSIYRIKYREAYYRRFCDYLTAQKQRIPRLKKSREGITLRVENIVFDRNEFYFVIRITNRSSLAYDLNFLNLSVQTRQKGKKKSLQTLPLKPKFSFGLPERVAENESKRMVYVLPKFSLSDDRRAVLELNEKSGGRNLVLNISHGFINNPN